MLKRIAASLLCAAALCVAVGCGSPSGLEICHAACDFAQRCQGASSVATTNCNNNCDNTKGTLSDQDAAQDRQCKNSGARRSQVLNCAHAECDKAAACLAAVDGCVTN